MSEMAFREVLADGCVFMGIYYSPGRFRILPNSLSLGSISMRVVDLAPGTWECEPCFVSVLEGLDAMGNACGRVGVGPESAASLSADSAFLPGMYQFFRLSSHVR